MLLAKRLDIKHPPSRGELVRDDAGGNASNGDGLISVTNRSRCGSYSSCLRWRYTPRWSSCIRKYVQIRSYVRAHKGLEEVAPEDQSRTKVHTL